MGQMNVDRSSLELLLRLARFGETVSEALSQTPSGASVTDNVSIAMLCHLELYGPQRPIDIVEFTGLTSGGVTKLVTRLESSGLVERERHALEHDKRAVYVSLTEEGHDLMRTFSLVLRDRFSDAAVVIKELNRFVE